MTNRVCSRCGQRGTTKTMIVSRSTSNSYCRGLDACAARVASGEVAYQGVQAIIREEQTISNMTDNFEQKRERM